MSFSVQPWQFGHGEVKRTGFWTRGLPPLLPTEIAGERVARVHLMAPGPDRQKERSRTYPGIAGSDGKAVGRLRFHIEQSMCLPPPGIARWFVRGAIIVNGTAHEIAG